MARPIRLEFCGALYHVTSRDDDRESIYLGDEDRLAWLTERPANWKEGEGPVARPVLWFNCGIYLPDDANKPALVYTIAGSVTSQGQQAMTDAAVTTVATQPVVVGATPLQAGIAGGIATGLIAGAVALEDGNFILTSIEVKRTAFDISKP